MNKARGGKGKDPETSRRWRQWKEPEARAVLADWSRSGLSAAAAFAKSRGFSEKRMWYWSKRLGARSAEQATMSFVEHDGERERARDRALWRGRSGT